MKKAVLIYGDEINPKELMRFYGLRAKKARKPVARKAPKSRASIPARLAITAILTGLSILLVSDLTGCNAKQEDSADFQIRMMKECHEAVKNASAEARIGADCSEAGSFKATSTTQQEGK